MKWELVIIITCWLFAAMMQAAHCIEFKIKGDRSAMWQRMILCFILCLTAAMYITKATTK